MTGSQSPAHACRKSRALGYHGESSRTSSQRQSAFEHSSTHTGRPIAPARCAPDVSMDMTKSSDAMIAAVSAKSATLLAGSSGRRRSGNALNCARATELTPRSWTVKDYAANG